MELKPCPFCGANDAVETDMEGMRRTVYFVSCNKCGAAGPSRVYPDHSQPLTEADLWNRRATAAPQPVTPVAEELKPPLEEVVAFLCGEKPLHGYWFGNAREGMGPYWWREELRNAMARRASPAPEQSDWERAESYLFKFCRGYAHTVHPLYKERDSKDLAALLAEVRAEERERALADVREKAQALDDQIEITIEVLGELAGTGSASTVMGYMLTDQRADLRSAIKEPNHGN